MSPGQGQMGVFGHEAPPWWHFARRGYDRAILLTGRLGIRAALSLADVTGRLAQRIAGRPSPHAIAKLLPDGCSPEPQRLARDLNALRYVNRALYVLVPPRGSQILAPCVDPAAHAALRAIPRPAVLLTWHVGPAYAVGAALAAAGVPALGVRQQAGDDIVGVVDLIGTTGTPQARAQVFAQAVARLRRGGIVVVAADGLDGTRTSEVPWLGRVVTFARGPFAMARITGAPAVPVVARWNDARRIEVVVGAPLAIDRTGTPTEVETSCALSAARWFDDYIRQHPKELWFWTLRSLESRPTGP